MGSEDHSDEGEEVACETLYVSATSNPILYHIILMRDCSRRDSMVSRVYGPNKLFKIRLVVKEAIISGSDIREC